MNCGITFAVDISIISIFVDAQSLCTKFLLTFACFHKKIHQFESKYAQTHEFRIDFIILWKQWTRKKTHMRCSSIFVLHMEMNCDCLLPQIDISFRHCVIRMNRTLGHMCLSCFILQINSQIIRRLCKMSQQFGYDLFLHPRRNNSLCRINSIAWMEMNRWILVYWLLPKSRLILLFVHLYGP